MEKLRLRRSARKDSQRIEKLVYDYYFSLVPKVFDDIEEEEDVCKKIVDKEGHIIAGCDGYIYPWGCLYVDDMWVDERYRRQGLGSATLRAVEKVAKERGCHVVMLGTWDFQAKPYYLKNGYTVYSTVKDYPKGHEDYELFKRLDQEQTNRQCRPIDYEILDGTEEDWDYICDQLDNGYNAKYLDIKHGYIKLNRKLVNQDGKVVAAIMAGVSYIDVGWIWKIWVDEEYRHQGLGTLLVKHFEKLAKAKGATKICGEEIYDWNIDFFLKMGYKVSGALPDLPKGHTYYLIDKDI
ncbi:MAG: GNAT family N-acetyltransferase [Clostridia bacterium]|nr:GNAT family N-acetyltransferase [Clostridia bacterium]